MDWISVKDRLPEQMIPVLTCRMPVGDLHILMINFIGIRKRRMWYYRDALMGINFPHRVTHWMPLPEYPKDF